MLTLLSWTSIAAALTGVLLLVAGADELEAQLSDAYQRLLAEQLYINLDASPRAEPTKEERAERARERGCAYGSLVAEDEAL